MTRRLKRYFLILAIFVVALGGAGVLSSMKPPPETKDPRGYHSLGGRHAAGGIQCQLYH